MDTSWTIIERAAGGNAAACEHFAGLYAPALKAYFCKRWERTPYIDSVDDAVQDVFVDCFKSDGVLNRSDRAREGGFRAFFYGVARTTALRSEQAYHRNLKGGAVDSFDSDALPADDDSLTKVFDRAWALSIVQEAVAIHEERGRVFGGREELRVKILRQRFEHGTPIRDIAEQLALTPELAHKEYSRARKSFRTVLEDVIGAHCCASDEGDIRERCREVLQLLG